MRFRETHLCQTTGEASRALACVRAWNCQLWQLPQLASPANDGVNFVNFVGFAR
jgi:hypothetical protein